MGTVMNLKLLLIVTVATVITVSLFTVIDPDSDKPDVDVVRTDLAVGDYIRYNSDGVSELSDTVDTTHTEYLGNVYWTDDIPNDARTGKWMYDGFEKDCHIIRTTVNGLDYDFYVMTDSRFIIHKVLLSNNSDLNLDTNMDIGLPMSEQNLVPGTYYSYSSAIESPLFTYDYRVSKEIDAVDGDSLKITNRLYLRSGSLCDLKIVGFEPDGSILCEGGFLEGISATEYLRVIDYNSLISFLEQNGGTVIHGEKTRSVEDTFRGKRMVITEKISSVGSDGSRYDFTLHYGLAGVIYEIESEPIYEGAQRFTDTILDTNLLSVRR